MKFIPDVFVIGAMKAGTTALYSTLQQHPALCLTRTKEANIFLYPRPFETINNLYESQFKFPNLIKIDVSPSYTKGHLFSGVAERIFSCNQNAKIVFIARDPVERLISHLQHNLLRDRFKLNEIEQELKTNSDYLLTSSYDFQLSDYVRLFGLNNIRVVLYEDLINNPKDMLMSLSAFLNIEAIGDVDKVYSSESRYKIKYFDFVHTNFGEGALTKLYHYFWYLFNIKVAKPQLPVYLKSKLAGQLQDDAVRFSIRFNIDLKSWRNFYFE